MNTLRELRRDASLSQRALAELLDVPVNMLRMWDSGLRSAPAHMLLRSVRPLRVTRNEPS